MIAHAATMADLALLRSARDRLAGAFARALDADAPTAIEMLEEQLATTPDREKWRPLKDAIDLVRAAGGDLGPRVERLVKARFDAKVSPGLDPLAKTMRLSLDSLGLVADDEVQEEIAIGNAARRLREAVAEEIYGLTERLSHLLGLDHLPDDRNPAYPRVFARALMDALKETPCETPGRLAAFGAFSPTLLNAIPATYRDVNAWLVAQGVVPQLERAYGAPQQVGSTSRPAAPGPAGTGAPGGAPPGDASAALFERLVRGPSPATHFDRLVASAAPAPGEAKGEGLVTVQVRPELLGVLKALEQRSAATAVPPGDAATPAGANLLRSARGELSAVLSPADAVVADLVAAVFDRLFADAEMSESAREQVGRLQLPVFRAAMADQRFFTDRSHPIRQLIDTMAELGSAGDAAPIDGRTPTEWLVSETQTLLEAAPGDTMPFRAARDRLAGIAERHHEAQAEVDEVVAMLKEEESRLAAVQDASLEMAHRIGAAHCPEAAAALAYRAWRPVLVHDHRQSGKGSAQWLADLETLEDLLWTLTPRVSEAERLRLTTLLPSLRYRVKQGLLRSGLPRPEADALMEQMRHVHAELERSPAAAAHGEIRVTATPGPSVQDDVTATLRVSSEDLADEGLTRGAWFEFTDPDGTRRRCRLTWMSPIQGACVFKDLARGRSFAIALDDLRQRKREGLARAVDGPGVAGSSIDGALLDVARERGEATGDSAPP